MEEVDNYTKISQLERVSAAQPDSLFMMSVKNGGDDGYSSMAM